MAFISKKTGWGKTYVPSILICFLQTQHLWALQKELSIFKSHLQWRWKNRPQTYANCGTCVTEEETTICTGLRDTMEIATAILWRSHLHAACFSRMISTQDYVITHTEGGTKLSFGKTCLAISVITFQHCFPLCIAQSCKNFVAEGSRQHYMLP